MNVSARTRILSIKCVQKALTLNCTLQELQTLVSTIENLLEHSAHPFNYPGLSVGKPRSVALGDNLQMTRMASWEFQVETMIALSLKSL
jgi:hypothetical protein